MTFSFVLLGALGATVVCLAAAGPKPNFIVIFTDDQGWADLGCQGVRDELKTPHLDALAASGVRCTSGYITAPHLGEKGMLTEGGIRVPFLWSWKGVIPAGRVFDHPLSSLDIAATIFAAAGIEDRDRLDGVNVMPHLKGEITTPPHDALYWRFWKQAAIRAGDWKLLHLGDGTDFLFDLSQPDPETKNLASRHPEKVAELRAKLEAWTRELRPPGLPKNGIQRERLWYPHYLHHPTPSPSR